MSAPLGRSNHTAKLGCFSLNRPGALILQYQTIYRRIQLHTPTSKACLRLGRSSHRRIISLCGPLELRAPAHLKTVVL